MALLAGKLYDPAAAVTKACTSNIAITAFDTTNLRLNFDVPASGNVWVRQQCVVYGAATFPQILLAVLEGSTVKWRMAPRASISGTALATTFMVVEAAGLVTGLTPAANLDWDAAYGVEFLVAASNIRYGGPNDTTASNAWGGIAFEIWSVD